MSRLCEYPQPAIAPTVAFALPVDRRRGRLPGRLPVTDRQRVVLELRDQGKLSWRAIGEQLGGVSPQAAWELYQRATR